jgi:hypothetical protein
MGYASRWDAGDGLGASDDSQARVADAAHRCGVGWRWELVAVGVSEGSPTKPIRCAALGEL